MRREDKLQHQLCHIARGGVFAAALLLLSFSSLSETISRIEFLTPRPVLAFNGEELKATAYEGESVDGQPHGLGTYYLAGSRLFDELRAESVAGQLEGLFRLYVSPGRPNIDYRPVMICEAGFSNCREGPPPRDVYFRGQAVAGQVRGALNFYAAEKYVADLAVDDANGGLIVNDLHLFHPDSGQIPTRRFVGRLGSDWELRGQWFDVPWTRDLINQHHLSVNGNNAVFWQSGSRFMWAGSYGRDQVPENGIRLLIPRPGSPAEAASQPPSLARDSYNDTRYGVTVVPEGGSPEGDQGRFHGLIEARTPDGIVYRAPYNVKKALLIGPATVWSHGKAYQGSTDGRHLEWVSESKFERTIGGFVRGLICPLGGKRADDPSCNINLAFNVDSNGRVRLANNPGYEPQLTEYEAIKNARPEDLRRINAGFDAALGRQSPDIASLGTTYLLEARLYSALAAQNYSGEQSAADFASKLSASLEALDALPSEAALTSGQLFARNALANERAVNQVKIYRGPAGLIDILGKLTGFWVTVDASSQILDVKLRIDRYYDGAGNLEQKILIDRASRQVERIGISYLNNFAAQSAVQLNAAMSGAVFANLPELGKLTPSNQVKVLNDLRIDVAKFYQENQQLRNEGDFALALAREIESRLLKELGKYAPFVPPPMY